MTEYADNIFFQAHQAGWNKAISKAPEFDVIRLINAVVDFACERKSAEEIRKELADDYGPAVKAYLETFSDKAIKQALRESGQEGLEKLAKGDYSKEIKKTTINIADIVLKYMKGEIGEVKFVHELMESGIKDVCREFLKGCGIGDDILKDENGQLRKLSSEVIGYAAVCKAYEILMQSLEDASIAFEHRLKVEEACKQSIEQIRKYREQMAAVVSKYFENHFETIERGFEAMEQAILENDSNGYIRGNAELQKMLGFNVQFTNQEEFDDLMSSDIALKL